MKFKQQFLRLRGKKRRFVITPFQRPSGEHRKGKESACQVQAVGGRFLSNAFFILGTRPARSAELRLRYHKVGQYVHYLCKIFPCTICTKFFCALFVQKFSVHCLCFPVYFLFFMLVPSPIECSPYIVFLSFNVVTGVGICRDVVLRNVLMLRSVSYTHLTLPTIYSV